MSGKKQKTPEAKAARLAQANGHMVVTNKQIWDAREPLRFLLQQTWPVRTSFALTRLTNTLNGHLQNIQSVRNQLIEQYGTPVEGRRDAFNVDEQSENWQEYADEVNRLLDIEVEVAATPVVLPAFIGAREVEVPAGAIFGLGPFIALEGE